MLPTVERVRELLDYDPVTGALRWRVTRGPARAGMVAGNINSGLRGGYRVVMVDGKSCRAHRIAWAIYYGEHPVKDIDHIDGNRSNNAISNLRLATQSQNNANMRLFKNSTSGVKGVTWDKRRNCWRAHIVFEGKQRHLGRYPSREQAAAARRVAAERLYGAFARH